ncbi:hypothetical protein PHMEG_00020147 [Phytophthora megakarya]|uniref:Uncharacterized protein n=1 Tax=Phytophthora megakarya TaxID=4795 RepID=A0A225VR09_9STRA|nr:hypothetical protein PHMEG_00020147 [Phytophthora megakarya]
MKKLIEKAEKSLRKRGSSCNRMALLSTNTISCSITSDEEILAEIWAMARDDDMPEVDGEMEDASMEFLFFPGCPDDKNLRELDVGYRRLRSTSRAVRSPPTPSYATTVPVKPTLVSKMPPLFTPHL